VTVKLTLTASGAAFGCVLIIWHLAVHSAAFSATGELTVLAVWHLAVGHLTIRHLAIGHLAVRHLTVRHLAVRHLAVAGAPAAASAELSALPAAAGHLLLTVAVRLPVLQYVRRPPSFYQYA
jgi:hypothetical protein